MQLNNNFLEERATKVLLIEDDGELLELVSAYLARQGYDVEVEKSGDLAIQRVLELEPNIIILDVMLPGRDGFAICRDLRAIGISTPIIFHTAKDERLDELLALELGGDDFVLKPAEPRLLLARIRAVLRRAWKNAAPEASGDVLNFADLRIDRYSRRVSYRSNDIPLSAREFDLVWLLAANAGQVVTRDQISAALLEVEYDGVSRTVDSVVARLRKRLEAICGTSGHIKSVRPKGYMFCASRGAVPY